MVSTAESKDFKEWAMVGILIVFMFLLFSSPFIFFHYKNSQVKANTCLIQKAQEVCNVDEMVYSEAYYGLGLKEQFACNYKDLHKKREYFYFTPKELQDC